MVYAWLAAAAGVALVTVYLLQRSSVRRGISVMNTAETAPPDARVYDAVVIGGGPAGSSAALRLAGRGASVLVLEKSLMPRRKLCGGALSVHARNLLETPLPEHLVDQQVEGGIAVWGDHRTTVRHSGPIAFLVTRSAFDQHLLQQARQAGAEVLFEEARNVTDCGNALRIDTPQRQVYARCAIVAEGVTGRFQKYVRPANTASQQGVCMEADIPLDAPGAKALASHKGFLSLYLDAAPWGYGWVFHHGSYINVGIGGLGRRFTDPAGAMHDFLQRLGLPTHPEGLKGHLIPRGGIRRTLTGNRIMLVGDAAGFVDAFDGEGLAYAIRSGQLAGDTLLSALANGDFTAQGLRKYPRACRREFNRNLACSLRLSQLVYRFPTVFLKALAHNETLIREFFKLPLGHASYRRIMGRLLLHLPRVLYSATRK